jgi:hypothetical protein
MWKAVKESLEVRKRRAGQAGVLIINNRSKIDSDRGKNQSIPTGLPGKTRQIYALVCVLTENKCLQIFSR